MNAIRNLINITDLTIEEIDQLIDVADDIVEKISALPEVVRARLIK